MEKISRRRLLTLVTPAALGATVGLAGTGLQEDNAGISGGLQMKIMVVGAHPDDPETGCGGFMALCSGAGHTVVSAYLTRGEAGCRGKSHEEAAQIRTEEAMEACKILNARPEFLGQIDGSTEVTPKRFVPMYELFNKEAPDIIVTHWPIDSHRDHRICSLLVFDAWQSLNFKPALYYFEVMTGHQSQNFTPTDFVDISSVVNVKHQACFVHRSQNIEGTYDNDHGKMEIFRGMESGFKYAEAFIRHNLSPRISLQCLRLYP